MFGPARGQPERIALIHAVYGAAWGLVSLLIGGVSPWPATAILILALALVFGAARQLRRLPAVIEDPAVTRSIRRVNVVTALAAFLYGWLLSTAGHDALAVAAVLLVLGLHFVPLWLLLRRPVLLAMGVALVAIALCVWRWPAAAATGAFFAAMLFAGNSVRLLSRRVKTEVRP